MADNIIEGDFCDCGCGLEFIPQSVGYRFRFIDEDNGGFREGYVEWEMTHDLWINFIPNKGDILLWGEFKNLIVASHIEKPKVAVWTHLFNAFCVKEDPERFNARFIFVAVN
jgi:hypothetical protein